ncbi:NAD(P)H-dependent flavin oxidoreductase [Neptuniibacter halophilus]|uniref:NAD(P)H-dependent flavin oxidoreductase n=1 Tax=Neptuniibacter halophilus TaxID=651666 RepID=UPI002574300A|nr:nitronate monooxygenase [Neptuniibacter halophilus]
MDLAQLGMDIPIIQAPMAGAQDWRLAQQVSDSGALGSIPCGMLSVAGVVEQIEQFIRHSDRPYNLNFFCHKMPRISEAVLKGWQDRLAPYYAESGLQPTAELVGLRQPFSAEVADAIEPFAPPVISFHFGLPPAELLARVKAWGGIVLSSATTLEEGLWLQEHGADLVIAQGVEAGGHRGMFLSADLSSQLPTVTLLEQLRAELDIPLIAAGGIASGCDIRRMLNAGASAVQLGTSYLLCEESTISALQREALQDQEADTALTNLFSGRPARGIRNRLMQDLGDIHPDAPAFPYATPALVPLRQHAEVQGRTDFTPLWSGTDRSGCRALPAAELTRQLWQEAEAGVPPE